MVHLASRLPGVCAAHTQSAALTYPCTGSAMGGHLGSGKMSFPEKTSMRKNNIGNAFLESHLLLISIMIFEKNKALDIFHLRGKTVSFTPTPDRLKIMLTKYHWGIYPAL